ncbi:MAG: acyltransferase [Actinomycetota bacterium]
MAGDVSMRQDWTPLRHVPALDGLRGIAVLLVVLYHGPWPGVSGGFVGVDLFFVLSGFLITRLLIDEWAASGTIAMRAFYRRRAVRLLPALFFLVAVIWLLAFLFDTPSVEDRLGERTLWALSYVANWHSVVTQTHGGVFGHLWSLSVEEQFYVVWPLIVATGLRRRGLRFVQYTAVVGAIVTGVVAAGRAWSGTPGMVLYFSTESHGAVLLLAGSALGAFPMLRLSEERARLLMLAGMVGLFVLSIVPDREGPLHAPAGYLPIAVVSLALVAGVAALPRVEALEARPLTEVGKLSYGIYLWHVPMFKFAEDVAPTYDVPLALALTAVTVVVSYRLIERPAQRWRVRRPRADATRPVETTV